MWFHICIANHNSSGKSSLVDQVEWATAGLLDAGHQVTFSEDRVEPSAINLLWEYFTPDSYKAIVESGVTFGIAATEVPDGSGFNWRRDDYWPTRYEMFIKTAQRASFIWALVESAIPFYRQFGPTGFFELGFSKRLVPAYIDQAPSVDFSFFGQMTPYREAVIERMRRHASVFVPDRFLAHHETHEIIARSRIGLNFKQSKEWPVPSGPRLGRLLLAKRGVACEWLPEPTRQGEIAGICPPDRDFPEYALELLHSDWRGRAERAFDEYEARMPMKEIMDALLEASVTGLATSSWRRRRSRVLACEPPKPLPQAVLEPFPEFLKPPLRAFLKPIAEFFLTCGRLSKLHVLSRFGEALWRAREFVR